MLKKLPRITLPKSSPTVAGVGLRHVPGLDGLRGIAILLVIPHNIDVLPAPGPLEYPVAILMHAGWIGVQLFFVLSGFLITGALLESRRADNYFKVFFARRVLRIFPLYYAVLISVLVLAPILFQVPEVLRTTRQHQVWLWTFLSNWTLPFGLGVAAFGPFWSLAVEEQFYLLWPFVVRRCTIKLFLYVCAILTVAALLFRVIAVAEGWPKLVPYMFTISRMDALACGAAAAAVLQIPGSMELLRRWSLPLTSFCWVLFFAAALVTRGYSMFDPICETLGHTVLAAVFAVTVLLVSVPKRIPASVARRALSIPLLRMIGRYSFAMYLFHLPLHMFIGIPLLNRFSPQLPPWAAVAYTASLTLTVFILGALSYWLFESRFLSLKKYFVPVIESGHRQRQFAG